MIIYLFGILFMVLFTLYYFNYNPWKKPEPQRRASPQRRVWLNLVCVFASMAAPPALQSKA